MAAVLNVCKSLCLILHCMCFIYPLCIIYWCYSPLRVVSLFSIVTQWSESKRHKISPALIFINTICGFCAHIRENLLKLPIYCSYLVRYVLRQGEERRGEEGRGGAQWSFSSKGWVIFLLSTNLQLLNIQNNFGLNQVIQWSKVKSKAGTDERLRATCC